MACRVGGWGEGGGLASGHPLNLYMVEASNRICFWFKDNNGWGEGWTPVKEFHVSWPGHSLVSARNWLLDLFLVVCGWLVLSCG